jgi:hypothetical protein
MAAPVYETITLRIQSVVTPIHDYVPLTGVYSVDTDIAGWAWDRRLLESEFLRASRYDTFIGGHEAGLEDGTRYVHWQSGFLKNLELVDIRHFRRGEFLTWTPRVRTGAYAIQFDERMLYSDYSVTEAIDILLDENDAHLHPLRDDCLPSTVSVVLMQRDKDLVRRPKYTLEYVSELTGKIDETSNTRLDTVDIDGDIIWPNVAERKHEFVVVNDEGTDYIITNGDYSIEVGDPGIAVTSVNVEDLLERHEEGYPEGRRVFANYFPLAAGSVSLYTVDSGGSVKKWTEVPNLNFSKSTDEHFTVDYDLGILSIGGYQAPNVMLSEDIAAEETEITCYTTMPLDGISMPGSNDDLFSSYPEQGIITIGTERILYYNKGSNKFFDCVRGYDGTTPQNHSLGTIVSDYQHGAGSTVNQKVYISYTAVPRVQYEVTSHELRTGNKTPVLNIKATRNVETNNVIQINPVETNLAKIILEIDKPPLGGNIFGPLFFGTDYALLTATALDTRDNPVEDIEITIGIESGPGSLGGLSAFTALSNSLGQIYTLYNAPYDWNSVAKKVLNVEHLGADTKFTIEPLPPGTPRQEIWVYQVLKHDPVIGTQGLKLPVINWNAATDNPYIWPDGPYPGGTGVIPTVITIDGRLDDGVSRFSGGYARILGDDNVLYTHEITGVVDNFTDGTTGLPAGLLENHRLLLATSFAPGVTPLTVWLFEADAQEWNGAFLDGVRVILYEWIDRLPAEVLHPLNGSNSAYYPLHPDQRTSNTLTFLQRSLALPDPFTTTTNLGGYIVVASGIVSFIAWGRDPVTGRLIYSNRVRARIDLPNYLKGVDKSGTLPVPYGFGFVTEDFNVGSGIGGANFLTINPKAELIDSFSARMNIG